MDRIDGLIAHIKREVRRREERRRAGAGEPELERRGEKIRRLQSQLAYAVRDRLHADGRRIGVVALDVADGRTASRPWSGRRTPGGTPDCSLAAPRRGRQAAQRAPDL